MAAAVCRYADEAGEQTRAAAPASGLAERALSPYDFGASLFYTFNLRSGMHAVPFVSEASKTIKLSMAPPPALRAFMPHSK